MTTFLQNAWQWLVVSSADPQKTSLTVKMFLLGFGAYAVNLVSIACGVGFCIAIDMPVIQQIADGIEALLVGILSVVAALGFLYGLVRKVALTYHH